MSRDGRRIVSHKPKNLRLQIEKEILEIEEEILTPPEIIHEEVTEEIKEVAEEEIKEVIIEEILIEPMIYEIKTPDYMEYEMDFRKEEDERVICINTNIEYENNKIASELTGVHSGAIKRCCNGDTKSAGKDEEGNKLVWKYVKDL